LRNSTAKKIQREPQHRFEGEEGGKGHTPPSLAAKKFDLIFLGGILRLCFYYPPTPNCDPRPPSSSEPFVVLAGLPMRPDFGRLRFYMIGSNYFYELLWIYGT
jgi:hypothetical protein